MFTRNDNLIAFIKLIQAEAEDAAVVSELDLFLDDLKSGNLADEDVLPRETLLNISKVLINFNRNKLLKDFLAKEHDYIEQLQIDINLLVKFSIENDFACIDAIIANLKNGNFTVDQNILMELIKAFILKNQPELVLELSQLVPNLKLGPLDFIDADGNSELNFTSPMSSLTYGALNNFIDIDVQNFISYPHYSYLFSDVDFQLILDDAVKSNSDFVNFLQLNSSKRQELITAVLLANKLLSIRTIIEATNSESLLILVLKTIHNDPRRLINTVEMFDMLTELIAKYGKNIPQQYLLNEKYLINEYFRKFYTNYDGSLTELRDSFDRRKTFGSTGDYFSDLEDYVTLTKTSLKLLSERIDPTQLRVITKDPSGLNFIFISAIINGYFNLGISLLKRYHAFIHPLIIEDGLVAILKTHSAQFLEQMLDSLSPNTQMIKYLFIKSLSGVDSPIFRALIKLFPNMLADTEVQRALENVKFPNIARELVLKGALFTKDALKRFEELAIFEGDIATEEFFKKLINNDEITTEEVAPTKEVLAPSNNEPVLVKMYGSGISQVEYQSYVSNIISLICLALQNGKFKLTYEQSTQPGELTLGDLGQLRYEIAKLSGTENYEKFGRKRTSGSVVTPLNIKRYAEFYTDFLAKVTAGMRSPNLMTKDFVLNEGNIGIQALIITKINDKPRPLTVYDVTAADTCWVHTNPNEILGILNNVALLMTNVASKMIDTADNNAFSKLIQDMATIHWWLAHATPFDRGSAAITEWIVSALFRYHGYDVKWSSLADCKALIEPSVEEYAKNYKTFTKITSRNLEVDADNNNRTSLASSSIFATTTVPDKNASQKPPSPKH